MSSTLKRMRVYSLRREYFPLSGLDEDANVLIFPDLESGNLASTSSSAWGERCPPGRSRLPSDGVR